LWFRGLVDPPCAGARTGCFAWAGWIFQFVQIRRIAFLKPAVREAVLVGALVPSFNKVPRDIDAQYVSTELRRRQCRRSIAASEIQNLKPFGDSESLDECLTALSHTNRKASEVAFFPKRFVWIRIKGAPPVLYAPDVIDDACRCRLYGLSERTMRFFATMIVVGILVAVGGPAFAVRQGDWDECAQTGDPGLSIAGCTRVIQGDGETAQSRAIAYYNRGNAYQANGDLDRAIVDYNVAIQLDPESAQAYVNRGSAHQANGDLDRAIADYNEAIRLDANSAFAYINRGAAYVAKDRLDRGIADYNEAIRLDPESALAYNNRCYALAIVGQMPQALADCNESLRLRPNVPDTLDSRGLAYLKSGQIDNAIADYDAVLNVNPKAAGSLYGRGVAKLKKDDSAGGNADMAAAKAIQADIAEVFALYRVK
jgi:lipoprotein NlpI